jgi:flagellar biosynthesis GTPase FlhF
VSEASSYQRLREHLAYLELPTAAEQLAPELDRALHEHSSPTEVLERLLEAEVEATRARRARTRLRYAHYPVLKTLAEFDFDFQPSLDRKLVAELSTLRFVEEKRNVVLLGPPGVGKTHCENHLAGGARHDPKIALAPDSAGHDPKESLASALSPECPCRGYVCLGAAGASLAHRSLA